MTGADAARDFHDLQSQAFPGPPLLGDGESRRRCSPFQPTRPVRFSARYAAVQTPAAEGPGKWPQIPRPHWDGRTAPSAHFRGTQYTATARCGVSVAQDVAPAGAKTHGSGASRAVVVSEGLTCDRSALRRIWVAAVAVLPAVSVLAVEDEPGLIPAGGCPARFGGRLLRRMDRIRPFAALPGDGPTVLVWGHVHRLLSHRATLLAQVSVENVRNRAAPGRRAVR